MMPESHSHPHPQGDPPRPEGRSGSGFCGVLAFALSTCVRPPRVEVCFAGPGGGGAPAVKPHWPAKPIALEAPPPSDWTPGLGSLAWGSASTPLGEIL